MQQSEIMPARSGKVHRNTTVRSKNRKILGSILLVLALLALLIPMAAVAGTALYVRQTQMVLPGVSVGPVDVSNLPLSDAAQYIDNYWNNTTHLVVLNEDYKWTVTPPNIGLWIDPVQTAQQAYGVGRDNGGTQELLQLALQQAV